MESIGLKWLRKPVALGGLTLLAACVTPPPPPPPPPPPISLPEPQPAPMRPVPPNGAAPETIIPAVAYDGVRQTVNANLSTAQTTWNLRSGLNVAALNCLDPQFVPILDAYKLFLDRHEKQLAATNRALDREFRERYGADSQTVRDSYMTQVYNYFALPPAQDAFCAAALQLSQNYLLAPPEDLDAFAANALPLLDAAFLKFFTDFETYRVAAAAWDARYGPIYVRPATSLAAAAPIQGPVAPATSFAVVQPVPAPASEAQPASSTTFAVVQPLPTASVDQGAAQPVASLALPTIQPEPVSAPDYTLLSAPVPIGDYQVPAGAIAGEPVPVIVTEFPEPPTVMPGDAPAPQSTAPAIVAELPAAPPVAPAAEPEPVVQMISQPVVQPVPADENG